MKAAELKKYDQKLQTMRSELLQEFHHLRSSTPEMIDDESDLSHDPTHNADRDSEGLEVNLGIEKVEGDLLNQVDAAMRRIEQGTFGQCLDCQAEISRERLDALPFTAYCRECAETHE